MARKLYAKPCCRRQKSAGHCLTAEQASAGRSARSLRGFRQLCKSLEEARMGLLAQALHGLRWLPNMAKLQATEASEIAKIRNGSPIASLLRTAPAHGAWSATRVLLESRPRTPHCCLLRPPKRSSGGRRPAARRKHCFPSEASRPALEPVKAGRLSRGCPALAIPMQASSCRM